ncbi:DNA-deoxyinosine glycosylase [Flavobacterium sp. F-380]|uniref:DNA-deoxyinosine glycosylase n=1 Tax=Flavobacterium kayseriense TaxID=2764714 RepID=A0ABR7JAR6_9FLAO|nr:DNA-deoxyinosine glycosylase [Flavobacterium kayseriense]MBC5842623.1 DNA-deoxyinosine glycosylase [Flavobacterium kayseriense]MBC5849153.1 DNA-deoxyinosine glycosylase [Flavobacterium kayseriense]
MAEIIRSRTIRPLTRLEKSKSYKIDTKTISRGDTLVVNIGHETKSFCKTFKFNGADVAHKDSISFRVNDFGNSIDISWSGAIPTGTTNIYIKTGSSEKANKKKAVNEVSSPTLINAKTSFESISNSETTILILGTLPGDKSFELGEYYGHPRNKFWKIISKITGNDLPETYFDKKLLLLNSKIGVWDVAHKAKRKGSLDIAIEDEEPNDLIDFIERHKKLKVIGFNGLKSEVLFDKYFSRNDKITYVSLPSTSPANTSNTFENICKIWQQIVNNNS